MPVSPKNKHTYFLQTFGCQMNKADSEHMKGVLDRMHLAECNTPENADLILINTCSVRQASEDKVYGMVHNYGLLKEKKPELIIGITGCMVGHDQKRTLLKKMPAVDLYFPISEMGNLPQRISELRYDHVLKKTLLDSPIAYLEIPAIYDSKFEAFLPIMSGCDKFCTYCIVPYSRGREQSRSGKKILREIQNLHAKNYQLITLVGQNVNSYHPADNFRSRGNPYQDHFAALLWEIDRIGIPWVHFTAPHPRDMNEEVIDALTLPCMVNYLHLPVQSGDDQVLKKMNRGYTSFDYVKLVQNIRRRKPTMALGTDIIVGFPGETEEQFNNTLKLYKEADFDIAYQAVYSPRSHTPAARMKEQVPLPAKRERWQRLQELMEQRTEQKNRAYQNRTVEVLLREEKSPGVYIGDTHEMKKITVKASNLTPGQRTFATVQSTSTWMLYGSAEHHKPCPSQKKIIYRGLVKK